MFHDIEEWCKNWRGIDLSVKIDMRNLTIFWPEQVKNLTNLHFNGLLLTKVYNVWAKKSTEELCLMALQIDTKFEEKLTCASKNDMRNFANFHQNT